MMKRLHVSKSYQLKEVSLVYLLKFCLEWALKRNYTQNKQ